MLKLAITHLQRIHTVTFLCLRFVRNESVGGQRNNLLSPSSSVLMFTLGLVAHCAVQKRMFHCHAFPHKTRFSECVIRAFIIACI